MQLNSLVSTYSKVMSASLTECGRFASGQFARTQVKESKVIHLPSAFGRLSQAFNVLFLSCSTGLLASVAAIASDCHDANCHKSEGKHIESRIASANKLIKSGQRIEKQQSKLSNRIKAKLLVADAQSNPWAAYQKLFLEYERALAAYQQHRREYFAHSQQYHGVQSFSGSAESNTPYGQSSTSGQSSYEQSNSSPSMQQSFGKTTSPTGLTPLKVQAQDKCDALVALETKLIESEGNLSKLVSQLEYAQSRESQSMLIGMWSDAEQAARQVQGMASEFNHQGIQKTGSYSQNVHGLIMEANRDGDYGAHMSAYRELGRSNTLQQDIYKHANLHGQFALGMLSTLNALKPPGAIPGGGASSSFPGASPGVVTDYGQSGGGGSGFGPGSSYSATQLAQESRALDLEYSQVQELMSRLEVLRQALPPTPPKRN